MILKQLDINTHSDRINTNTEESTMLQIEERLVRKPDNNIFNQGIGGSDIAVILGLNKYRTPLDLWKERKGLKEPFQGNLSTRIGLALEPQNIAEYKDRTGNPVAMYESAVDGWYRRSPDGLVFKDNVPTIVYEGKTSFSFGANRMFGPESDGQDGVPESYQLQVQWYMAKPFGQTIVGECHVSALLTGPDHRLYTVHRNDELCRDMLQVAEHWWGAHIVGDIPPEAGAGDHADMVKRISTGNLFEVEEHPAIEEYQKAKADEADAKKRVKTHRNTLVKFIEKNESDGLHGDWGTIRYTPVESKRLNREMLVTELSKTMSKDGALALIERASKTAASSRFTTKFK